jgi:hypothetical protein
MHIGGGATHVSGADAYGEALTASGGSGSLGIALGGAILPNLIVFGNLFGSGVSKPTVTIAGLGSGTSNSSVAVSGIGPGVAYYFEPINLYLSGTLAAMHVEIDDVNRHPLYQSKTGVGGQVMVGKEWWISQNWGLGAAVEFVAASMKDNNNSNITWTSTGFSLLFSATYN